MIFCQQLVIVPVVLFALVSIAGPLPDSMGDLLYLTSVSTFNTSMRGPNFQLPSFLTLGNVLAPPPEAAKGLVRWGHQTSLRGAPLANVPACSCVPPLKCVEHIGHVSFSCHTLISDAFSLHRCMMPWKLHFSRVGTPRDNAADAGLRWIAGIWSASSPSYAAGAATAASRSSGRRPPSTRHPPLQQRLAQSLAPPGRKGIRKTSSLRCHRDTMRSTAAAASQGASLDGCGCPVLYLICRKPEEVEEDYK